MALTGIISEDHLDGHESIEAGLLRLVNDAHAASSQELQNVVPWDLTQPVDLLSWDGGGNMVYLRSVVKRFA